MPFSIIYIFADNMSRCLKHTQPILCYHQTAK